MMHSVALALVPSSSPPAQPLPGARGLRGIMSAMRMSAVCLGGLHVASVVGLVLLNKIVIDVYGFRFAATLTLLQYASIAVSLWFWSIFGLFKVRRVPFWDALRLAIGASFCSLLSMLSLKHNSLATYQAVRMTTAPVLLLVEYLLGVRVPVRRQIAICASTAILAGAIAIASVDARRNDIGLVFAVAGVIVTALYQVLSLSLRLTTKANELQLQLCTKSLGCICLLPFCFIFDNYSRTSSLSIFYFNFDEHISFLIMCTGLLTFLSFVAMRASINRNSPASYNTLVYLVSFFIFAAHFVASFRAPEARLSALYQVVPAVIVVLGTIMFAHARDAIPLNDLAVPSLSGSAEPTTDPLLCLRSASERDELDGEIDKLLGPVAAPSESATPAPRSSRSETDLDEARRLSME